MVVFDRTVPPVGVVAIAFMVYYFTISGHENLASGKGVPVHCILYKRINCRCKEFSVHAGLMARCISQSVTFVS